MEIKYGWRKTSLTNDQTEYNKSEYAEYIIHFHSHGDFRNNIENHIVSCSWYQREKIQRRKMVIYQTSERFSGSFAFCVISYERKHMLKRRIRLFTFHNQKFEILISLNEILLKLRQKQEDRKLFHL